MKPILMTSEKEIINSRHASGFNTFTCFYSSHCRVKKTEHLRVGLAYEGFRTIIFKKILFFCISFYSRNINTLSVNISAI